MFSRNRKTPLRAIQLGALNGKEPVTDLLRQIIAFGGRTGSQDLMDWAHRELTGYNPGDPLPDYRKASAPLQIDGMTQSAQIKQQTIAPFDLPDFAQGHISNDLSLRMSIAEIEHLAKVTRPGTVVKLAPPGSDDLVSFMNRDGGARSGYIERLYWSVSPVVLTRVLEGVRTTLVSLTAQIEAVTPPAEILPSSEGASASVALVVYGDRSKIKNVTIYNAGTAMSIKEGADKRPWWRQWWAIAGFVVALLGVALALMQVQGWRF